MYRCEICRTKSKPGEARLTHPIYRTKEVFKTVEGVSGYYPRQELERELAVCRACALLLTTVPLAVVQRQRSQLAKPLPSETQTVEIAAPPPPEYKPVSIPIPTTRRGWTRPAWTGGKKISDS